MAKYKCEICGYIFDEEKEGKTIDEIKECPVCKQPPHNLKKITTEDKTDDNILNEKTNLDYPSEILKSDSTVHRMDDIHYIATHGKSIIEGMGTKMPMPSWDDILILANQLNPTPLPEDATVSTETIIGKNSKKPLIIDNPIYISHMSFGALSYETKIALSKGSAIAKTAMCSGEGGILPEEMESAYKYIFEYVPNKYSVTEENLRNSDAIEIKIGQGTKPGMGGHLPGSKVTKEIAELRGKNEGEDIISPSKFSEINSKEDLKDLVSTLRKESENRPIGIKLAGENVEKDLDYIIYSGADFVTIDGRGGATAASPKLIRDATSLPTIFALYRARKFLDENNSNIDLVITGGLRVSSDFAKALAMGADAIAVASAPLMAAGCQQYRICGTGECPAGIATQDPDLRSRFESEKAVSRVANYLNVSLEELKTFARITGNKDVHNLNINNLTTFNSEISNYTNIKHM